MAQVIDVARDVLSIVGGIGTLVSTSGTDCTYNIQCSVERDMAIGEILGAAETIGSAVGAVGRGIAFCYNQPPAAKTFEAWALSTGQRAETYGKYLI